MTRTSANGCPQLTLTFALTLSLGLLCWPLGEVRGQAELSPALILQDLLSRYGENGSISVPQLRSLLAHLSTERSGENAPTAAAPTTNRSTVRDTQLPSQARARAPLFIRVATAQMPPPDICVLTAAFCLHRARDL